MKKIHVVLILLIVTALACGSGGNSSVPWIAGDGADDGLGAEFAEGRAESEYYSTREAEALNAEISRYAATNSAEATGDALDRLIDQEQAGHSSARYDFSWWDGSSDVDCKDLGNRRQAQAFFEWQGGPARDPHYLDGDLDGFACENLGY